MGDRLEKMEQFIHAREDMAKHDIGNTAISSALAYIMTVFFALFIFGIPVIQIVYNHANNLRQPYMFIIGLKDVFSQNIADASELNKLRRYNTGLLAEINTVETLINKQSVLTKVLLPPIQDVLLKAGYGNEKVYVGRKGWLFYKQSVEHLTDTGFLEDKHVKTVIASENELHPDLSPDPLPAIIRFHNDLSERGIQLIVVPVPPKPGIHPEYFAQAYDGKIEVKNASYDIFIERLRLHGITVFDVYDYLAQSAELDSLYLATDTHWKPECMETVAKGLGSLINSTVDLKNKQKYLRNVRTISGIGDLTAMLNLPPGNNAYSTEQVTVHQIVNQNGRLWSPDQSAEILLLGDSFTNIFTVDAMGWGEAAGLAPQLSFVLSSPVDIITRNDEGAYATRQMVYRELKSGNDRLKDKKVVVWEFAGRELSFGDWKVIPLDYEQSASVLAFNENENSEKTVARNGMDLLIIATISQTSNLPEADTLEYPDCLIITKCRINKVINGTYTHPEILVAMLAIKDYTNTKAARFRAGDQLRIELSPFSEAEESLKIIRQADDIEDYELELFVARNYELISKEVK